MSDSFNVSRARETLSKEDKTEIFKPDLADAIEFIRRFLEDVEKAEMEEVFGNNAAKTFILRTQGYVGECTSLNGKSIHLTVTRHDSTTSHGLYTLTLRLSKHHWNLFVHQFSAKFHP